MVLFACGVAYVALIFHITRPIELANGYEVVKEFHYPIFIVDQTGTVVVPPTGSADDASVLAGAESQGLVYGRYTDGGDRWFILNTTVSHSPLDDTRLRTFLDESEWRAELEQLGIREQGLTRW